MLTKAEGKNVSARGKGEEMIRHEAGRGTKGCGCADDRAKEKRQKDQAW